MGKYVLWLHLAGVCGECARPEAGLRLLADDALSFGNEKATALAVAFDCLLNKYLS
jgi:hypothetical protein